MNQGKKLRKKPKKIGFNRLGGGRETGDSVIVYKKNKNKKK